ncbi:hypothetical protein ACFVTY_01645 [Streptomyces sp. NPDC058067]|uniref:hypothetical protein n=1 Tax=Streptomyces sp. NPDC058067 TaxID=3346324 RepID=UPI0036F04D7E
MTTEPRASAAFEELRRAEIERREQRRRARESGAISPLRARRRDVTIAAAAQVGSRMAPAGDELVPEYRELPSSLQVSPRVSNALQLAAAAADDPEFHERALERAAHAPDPVAELAREAIELMGRLEPLAALKHLVELNTSGLPVLSEDQRLRAEAIRSGRLPLPAAEPEPVDAWQLHLESSEAFGHATLSTAAWQCLVECLPLPILDDLIDRGALQRQMAPHTWPEQSDRVRYVTARLTPWELSDADIAALEWQGEAARRVLASGALIEAQDGRHDEWSLRSALLGGEVAALDAGESYGGQGFPTDLADLVVSLRRVREGHPVDARLGRDRSLFGLLEDCLPDGRLISGNTAFHFWAGTRRMYRLLDDMHWAMACEPDQAADVLRAAFQQAAALRNWEDRGTAAKADREARAVQAYLYFLNARPGDRDRLDQGVGLLEDVLKRGGARRGGVDGQQRHRMRTLSELLQSLRLKSKPHEVLNPYLALCVEHGSAEWGQGWRDLRRQVATEQLEYINGAKDRIRRIETARRLGEGAEYLYELPLNERFLWVPDDRNEVLQPYPRRLERRTGASTEQEQAWTATEAAREIIGRSAGRLRNDH